MQILVSYSHAYGVQNEIAYDNCAKIVTPCTDFFRYGACADYDVVEMMAFDFEWTKQNF